MAKRKQKLPREWIAIITVDQGHGVRAIVISDDNGEPVLFTGPDEIRKIMVNHILMPFVWSAFCVTSGEVDVLG